MFHPRKKLPEGSSLFKGSALLEQFDDRKVLRAGSFALTTLDTVGGLASFMGDDDIFPLGTEFRLAFLTVFDIEDLGDRDVHRTTFRTVVAGCTFDLLLGRKGFLCFFDDFFFMFIERLKVFHEGKVVLHLFEIGHAAQSNQNIIQAADKA